MANCLLQSIYLIQLLWKTVWYLEKKTTTNTTELSHDPVFPLLGIYPKEFKSGLKRDICISMSIEALFTIAKW